INHNAVSSVSEFPCNCKSKLRTARQGIVFDFIGSVTRLMVIIMDSVKEEDCRNSIFSKVVMVGSIVESVRVIEIIITVVKFHLRVFAVGFFGDDMKIA